MSVGLSSLGHMTTIALFHSVLGVRPGVLDAAEMLRSHGHTVHVVDQYDGRVFDDYDTALEASAQRLKQPAVVWRSRLPGLRASLRGPEQDRRVPTRRGRTHVVPGARLPAPGPAVLAARWRQPTVRRLRTVLIHDQ